MDNKPDQAPRVLLFDLGGVLVQWDGVDALQALCRGSLERESVRKFWIGSPWVQDFERGDCTEEQFANGVVTELNLSVSEAARRLGVSRQQLHRILGCTHPITVEMALRIGKLAGNGPGLWLRMQQSYDLWHAEYKLKGELKKIRPAASA